MVCIRENEVLQRLYDTIDDCTITELARLHNEITNYEPINAEDIQPEIDQS